VLDDLHDAVEQGLGQVESMLDLESQLIAKGLTVDRGTSAHLHSLMVANSGSQQQKDSALNAVRILAASSHLKNKYISYFNYYILYTPRSEYV
jgi:hypothetical protein